MLKDSIDGLGELFSNEPPNGSIILVVGVSGTLKSAFIYNLLSKYLEKRPKLKCNYITMETTKDTNLQNIKNMNIPINDRINIIDLATFRAEIFSSEDKASLDTDYHEMIFSKILSLIPSPEDKDPGSKNESAEEFFVLDSLNAYRALNDNTPEGKVRRHLNDIFYLLKSKKITSFFIDEGTYDPEKVENFIADGIIELGIIEQKNAIKRYIVVHKMRATKHKLEKHLVFVDKNGIAVKGEII